MASRTMTWITTLLLLISLFATVSLVSADGQRTATDVDFAAEEGPGGSGEAGALAAATGDEQSADVDADVDVSDDGVTSTSTSEAASSGARGFDEAQPKPEKPAEPAEPAEPKADGNATCVSLNETLAGEPSLSILSQAVTIALEVISPCNLKLESTFATAAITTLALQLRLSLTFSPAAASFVTARCPNLSPAFFPNSLPRKSRFVPVALLANSAVIFIVRLNCYLIKLFNVNVVKLGDADSGVDRHRRRHHNSCAQRRSLREARLYTRRSSRQARRTRSGALLAT
jgi:hypothetical protein